MVNNVTRQLGHPRIYLERTTSTMDEVANRAGDAPEGLTVIAREQTHGRGRAAKQWHAVPGSSLLFSTLLRPRCDPVKFQVFPLLAGLAVAETIESSCGVAAQVKWPNDVLITGKKAAGLLVTTRVANGIVDLAVLGIGINLLQAPDLVAGKAIALAEATNSPPSAEVLLEALLRSLSQVYDELLSGEIRGLLDRWIERAAYLNEAVEILDGAHRLTGTFSGITETGCLVLQTSNGEFREVHAGDLVRGPVKLNED